MTRIDLNGGYFIEIDPLNYTLKQNYEGKDKEGNAKEQTCIHGYYGNMEHVMEVYLQLMQLDNLSDMALDMKRYAEMVEESNKKAVRGLYDVLKAFPVK